MYARNVTLHLRANSAPEFTRMLETEEHPCATGSSREA